MILGLMKTLFRKKKRVEKIKTPLGMNIQLVKDVLCVVNKMKPISCLNGTPYNVYYIGGSLVVEYDETFVSLHLMGTGTIELETEIEQDPELLLLTRYTYLNFKGNTKQFKDVGKRFKFDEDEIRGMIKGMID